MKPRFLTKRGFIPVQPPTPPPTSDSHSTHHEIVARETRCGLFGFIYRFTGCICLKHATYGKTPSQKAQWCVERVRTNMRRHRR